MDEAEELRDIINATNIEGEYLLGNVLAIASLEHRFHVSIDPEIALSEVLSHYVPDVRSATKSFAATKLFRTEKRDKLLPQIDIGNLDSGLVLGLLLQVERVLGIARRAGVCNNTLSHVNICYDDCVRSCDHSSPTCKKCIHNKGKPTGKCNHKCKHCHNMKEQCRNDAAICCITCKRCVTCNKKLVNGKINQLLGTGVAASTSMEPCGFFMFLFCLDVLLKLRNLFAHATTKQLRLFLNGTVLLKGFEMCNDKPQLFKYIDWVFSIVLDYVRDKNNFKNPLINNEYIKHKENLKSIFKSGKNLQKFIMDNYKKMKLMYDTVIDIINSKLGESIMVDKIGAKEIADKQGKGWRRIIGGVILKLDIVDTDEVKEVLCCKTDSVNNPFVIQHKSCVKNMDEQYYETQRINDTLTLLKIENMEDGNYKIDVKTQSTLKSIEVEVDRESSFKIGKTGIELPSSDVKEFWKDLFHIINKGEGRSTNCKVVWSEGANNRVMHTAKEFEEIGIKYFQRNFADEEITCFKPTRLIDNEAVKNVVSCLEKLLMRKCAIFGKKIVILVSPDLQYHLAMINNNIESLKEMKRGFQPCLLVFVEERSLIMIVRVVLDPVIKEDVTEICQRDILNFVNINRFTIQEENVNIVGVIACPFIKRNQLKNTLPFQFAKCEEHLYEKFFLCEDDLQLQSGGACMDKWWNILIYNVKRNVDVNNYFSPLIGRHMASMASVQEDLPTVSDCTHQQILTLMLTPAQINAIESKNKKKLITGPFGSGKSLIGQRILKKLAAEITESGEDGMLCYISCNPYTIIDAHIKSSMKNVNNNEKLTFLCGSIHDLSNVHVKENASKGSLDVLIEVLSNKFKNPNYVIDEIDESSMTAKVAKNINQLLSTLKHSHMVFIKQSLNKVRTYRVNCGNGKYHTLEADHFLLINNLEHHPLHRVMRLTVENQSLLDCAQSSIQLHTFKVLVPKSLPSKQGEPPSNIPKQQDASTENSFGTFADAALQSLDNTPDQMLHAEFSQKAEIHDEVGLYLDSGIDLDTSLRWMANPKPFTLTNGMIQTDIRFVSGEKGHNIGHHKPQLFYLPKSIPMELDSIKYLSPLFDICLLENENPVLIAYSIQTAKLFYQVLKDCCKQFRLYIPYLQQRIPSIEEKEEVIRDLQETSDVLITDSRSFIGMEAKNVVMMVDPMEKHLQHSIVEIISRCTTNLQIIVPFHEEVEECTASKVLKGWEQEELIEVHKVVLNTENNINNRPIIVFPQTHNIIVNSRSNCIMEHNIQPLSNEEQKQFHILPEHEDMGNFIQSLISPFQPTVPSNDRTIIDNIEVDGKQWKFNDVWKLLKNRQFDSFNCIVIKQPNILNNLHGVADVDYTNRGFGFGISSNLIKKNFNKTLLMQAIIDKREDIFEFLITSYGREIDVLVSDDRKNTAFHMAASRCNVAVMETLLTIDRRGLDGCDYKGETPLHYAVRHNRVDMVRLLLRHGADAGIKSDNGQTAYDLGNREMRMEISLETIHTVKAFS